MAELEYGCRRNESGVIGIKRLSDGRHLSIAETRNLLNAQSAEIAGMRDLLKGVIEFADSGDFDGAISLALYRRIQSAIGVELPNPSEIPNSSEVSDAAESD